jgi:hypothetical protein
VSGTVVDVIDMTSKSRKQRVKLLDAEASEGLASTAILAEAYLQVNIS